MLGARLGQKYYRVGGDSSGDKKSELLTAVRWLGYQILILMRKSTVAGQDLNLRPLGYKTENAVEYILTHMRLRLTQSA